MTVYVDALHYYPETMIRSAQARRYGNYWSHVWADTEEELSEFARAIKLPLSWLQHAGTRHVHFDVTPARRERVVKAGAIQMERRAWLRKQEVDVL